MLDHSVFERDGTARGYAARRGGDTTYIRRGSHSAFGSHTATARYCVFIFIFFNTMALEIQLIHEIEKYDFLYNFNLAAYNRKDVVEQAWGEIAASTNLTVSECKEKWRNIRSSFLRSMKQMGHKIKKPYYLSEYLKFLMPFLKPLNVVENSDDVEAQQSGGNSDSEVMLDFIKVEPDMTGYANEGNTESNTDSVSLSDLLSTKPNTPMPRKRRRFVPIRRNGDFAKTRKSGILCNSTNEITTGSNALRMFLLSLLPELESMSQSQIRLFKIKTMTLIDEIKSNNPPITNNNSLNSERLQKRLINLLLKNLESNLKDKVKS